MERELLINVKKIKELVSNSLEKKYEDISIGYGDDWIIEVKQGHFIEEIPFTDKRILQALNFEVTNLELDYVNIHDDGYSLREDATDEEITYVFFCKEREMGA
jgi:hypothetical protein